MEIKNTGFDFNKLENIDNSFIDVNVILNNERTYIVPLNTWLSFIIDERRQNRFYIHVV